MNPRTSIRRRGRAALLAAAAAALTLTAGACSAGAGDDGGASEDSAVPASAPEREALGSLTSDGLNGAGASAVDSTMDNAAADTAGTLTEGPATPAIIATGYLRVTAEDTEQARADALAVVRRLRGTVADEQSTSNADGDLDQINLTLRVPADSFEQALEELGALGTLRERSQSAEDVTTQVIDNDARVRTQAASVASIRRLLSQAEKIGEVISIERELSRRQGQLDSLLRRQKWLADQTSLSTINLDLAAPSAADSEEDKGGFLGGLESGWEALGESARALATGVGAALPFAAVGALIAAPLWIALRRRSAGKPAEPAEPAASDEELTPAG